ncbi:hypothetical protein PENANT_c005G11723 [Penicillium antarcticum]|uniref:HNH nuclease domain-containing protein n=1 Tax=Penicillium antarcticum TaxID=416450 RepID=A0A1V6QEV5_9EURO|nr:hypothetical protein PENANT_c005G11723 [Penicillium antarcticum]
MGGSFKDLIVVCPLHLANVIASTNTECVVIDDECLQTLLGTSAKALAQEIRYREDLIVRYVKVIEAWPLIDQYDTCPG